MCQRFIDINPSSREYFLRDEKTKRWAIRDGSDPRAVIKHLRSEDTIDQTTDQPPLRNRAMAASIETTPCGPESYPTESTTERTFMGRPMPPTVPVLNQYSAQTTTIPAGSNTRCEEVGAKYTPNTSRRDMILRPQQLLPWQKKKGTKKSWS